MNTFSLARKPLKYLLIVFTALSFLLVISSAIVYFVKVITIRFVGKTEDLAGKRLFSSFFSTPKTKTA